MLNDSFRSLVTPDRRTRPVRPRTVVRRPAFIGVVQAGSGHRNPEGDLFTPPRSGVLDPGLLLGDQALHELGPFTSRFVLHFFADGLAWLFISLRLTPFEAAIFR